MTPREELEALRRLAELERKAGNPAFAASAPQADRSGPLSGIGKYVSGATNAATDALSFGLGDEIRAGMDTLIQKLPGGAQPRTYEQNLAAERERERGFSEQNPVTSAVAGIAGGLANPIARALPTGAGLTMGRQALTSAGAGAGMGAAYGLGEGEGGLGNRLENATSAAVVGGVVGGAAPPVLAGVSKGLQWTGDALISRFFPGMQQNQALRKAAQALADDGFSPDEAAQRLASMGPDAVMADLGKNTRSVTAALARAGGAPSTAIDDFVTKRQEGVRDAMNVLQGGQIDRIGQGVDRLVPQRFTELERAAMEGQRAAAANPLYQRTTNDMNNLVPEDALAPLLQDEYLAGVFNRVTSNPLTGLKGAPNQQLAVVDAVKKELDDQISAAQRAGRNNEARLIMGRKAALVDVADQAFPEYARARDVWRNFSDVIDAGDMGRKIMTGGISGRPDALKKAVDSMGPEELQQVRIGAAQAVRDRLGSLNTRQDATKKLMDIPDLENKVRMVFGDDDMFKRYIDMLSNERAMFDTYAAVRTGSPTAERLAADQRLSQDPGGMLEAGASLAANPLNPMNYARLGLQAIRSGGTRMTTPLPVRQQMAEILLSQDTAPLSQPLRTQQMAEEQRRMLARLLTTSAATSQGP